MRQVFITRGRNRDIHDTDCFTYRCFLPDLTGFANVCHMESTSSHAAIRVRPLLDSHRGLSTPHKRISGYRAPLAPRLAQPRPEFIAGGSDIHSLLEFLTNFEKWKLLGGYIYDLAGLGISPLISVVALDLEAAKTSNFDPLSSG